MRNCRNKLANEIVNDKETHFAFQNIWKASKDGNLDVVRKLVDEGEDINAVTRLQQTTPLILVQFNINRFNQQQQACKFNHFLIAKFLINENADIDLKDKKDKTAKDYAKESNSEQILKLLKENE